MSIQKKDKDFVWHPFTHLKDTSDNIVINKAEGLYYYDASGKKYMDVISSWWVNLHGHAHPYITKKITEQLQSFEHVIFSGFTHQPAVELSERILKHLPKNQSKVFFSDNGSTAVEVALKMVFQYWHNKGIPKSIFIALENAYHGDTFGGMSVGARNVFNSAFENQLFNVAHIPIPTNENIHQIKEVIADWNKNHYIAGFIFEPLVQGAAGMQMYEASLLDDLVSFCKNLNIITIADEVMTGFGRTGKFFASDYLENKPDILCMSKGLTGGYFPLGLTSCSQQIYEAYLSDDKAKTFFHGHSYTGNPTSCAAALASLDLMEKDVTWEKIKLIEEKHRTFLNKIKNHKACKAVRMQGTILAIEILTEEESHYLNKIAVKIPDYFLEKGIIMRPLGNIIYFIPPYCIEENELEYVYNATIDFLNSIS
ncbi:MAG: adenosylmethionine--8-amino-7-oxononanoate transaminase [Bacteroidia bacterium]|nr:adenosylmethionine--8-amino-7-oxononanoate transaminase [Bacteroidia bacterium]